MFGFGANEEGGDGGNDGLWGALAVAGLGLLSSQNQKETNEKNVELGREQMAFQERMSNSAYQRAVADMQKAGINPMLVTQVGGANSPQGAMPQVQNTIAPALASASQATQMLNEFQKIQQTEQATKQMAAITEKVKSETMEKDLNTAQKTEELLRTRHETRGKMFSANREGIKQVEEDLKQQLAIRDGVYAEEVSARGSHARQIQQQEAANKAQEAFWDSDLGKSMPWLRSILELVRGSHSAYRAIKP